MTRLFETRPTVRGDWRFHWLGTFAMLEKQQLCRHITSSEANAMRGTSPRVRVIGYGRQFMSLGLFVLALGISSLLAALLFMFTRVFDHWANKR